MRSPAGSTASHSGERTPPSSKGRLQPTFSSGGSAGSHPCQIRPEQSSSRQIDSTRVHIASHTCTHRFRCLLTRARRHRSLAGTQDSSLTEDLGNSSRASTWNNGQSLSFSTRGSTGNNPAMLQGRCPQRSFMVSGLPGRDWAECEH